MRKLARVQRVDALRLGADPAFDAWYYTFRAENNIEHHINERGVAGDEQLAFMVQLPPNGIYTPCSDVEFGEMVESYNGRGFTPALRRQYASIWRLVARLVRAHFAEPARRRDMLNYCRHRFSGSLALRCILPSRLIKRLLTTVISQSGTDLWVEARQYQNACAEAFMKSLAVTSLLDTLPQLSCQTLPELHRQLGYVRLTRLLCVAASTSCVGGSEKAGKKVSAPTDPQLAPTLIQDADAFTPQLAELFQRQEGTSSSARLILYLCSSEGGFVQDLAVVEALLQMGHKVVVALKEEPYFLAPLPDDLERDPVLMPHVTQAVVLRDNSLTKNELLRHLRERRLVFISDGTSETLNLYRTSITFARAWKECDMVLAKGARAANMLLETTSRFTRDILCFWAAEGRVNMHLKLRPFDVRKFSESDLNAKAANIIRQMRAARDQGRTVMFYSCIIGSIPGETSTAIALADTIVSYLRESMRDPDNQGGVFIINPAEHFEEGMDGDDLMFMWETVQRSGLINIWRFQSAADVEHGFSLLNRHMPPGWLGKDATFSTGCTKEMRIALDMQRKHPELQIIGPESEKFFRRANYGVGKFFDATLSRRQEAAL